MLTEDDLQVINVLTQVLQNTDKPEHIKKMALTSLVRQMRFSIMVLIPKENKDIVDKFNDLMKKYAPAPQPAEVQTRNVQAQANAQQATTSYSPPLLQKKVYEVPKCEYIGDLVRKSGCSCKNHVYKCKFKNSDVKLKECLTCPQNPANKTVDVKPEDVKVEEVKTEEAKVEQKAPRKMEMLKEVEEGK